MIELIIKANSSRSLLKDDGRIFALNDSEICFSSEHIGMACEMRKSNVYSWHLLLREDYLESICFRLGRPDLFTSKITLKRH